MKRLIPILLPFLLLTLTQFAREAREVASGLFDWSQVNSQSDQAKYIAGEIRKWQSQDPVDEGKS